jgi:hypothetical protein
LGGVKERGKGHVMFISGFIFACFRKERMHRRKGAHEMGMKMERHDEEGRESNGPWSWTSRRRECVWKRLYGREKRCNSRVKEREDVET